MKQFKNSDKLVLYLSLPLAVLIIIVSCVGLLTPDFYSSETLNWQAQSIGQDMVDLFLIAPCLIITAVLAYKNSKKAFLIWGGVMTYLTYTFVLYCFDVHFNELFVLYCFGLGLSIYSLMYFIFKCYKDAQIYFCSLNVTRFTGFYFIIISVMFYILWLSEIIPAIVQAEIPKSVIDAGLFTNGVQVIDLAIILPAIFITGIWLLKIKPFANVLAPAVLTFFILMDLTIGILAVIMNKKGIESDLMITIIMSVLALFSLALLIWYLNCLKRISSQ